MPETLSLYPFQEAALNNVRAAMRAGNKRVILYLPTGGGKTVLAMMPMKGAADKGSKAAFVCDRITLVEQTSRQFQKYGITHGVAQGQNTFGRTLPVQVMSVQTLTRRKYWDGELSLLVIDECHTSYRKLLESAKRWDGLTIGLSASPITQGLGQFWDCVINAATTNQLLNEINPTTGQAYLAPLAMYAAHEIDMQGALVNSTGEWQAADVQKRGRAIIGSIVPEWEKRTRELFGGPVPTLVFSRSVDQGSELAKAFIDAGYDARQSSYKDSREETIADVDAFASREFPLLISVDKFCLDAKTEILTTDGWVGMDDMDANHFVANWWEDGSITYSHPLDIIRRTVRPDEFWVTHSDRLRVTSNHQMVHRHPARDWKWSEAKALVGRKRQLPISGKAGAIHFSRPLDDRRLTLSFERRLAANSYYLRKVHGMTDEESKTEASRRIDERDSMVYKSPNELSEDECSFIGFWMGDGSFCNLQTGGVTYTLAQSTVYPQIIDWIDQLLGRLNLDYSRGTWVPEKGNLSVRWNIGRGTGFGSQKRNGLYAIEPYLVKDGSPMLWGLNRPQFDAFVQGLKQADGRHTQNDWIHIGNTNYKMISLVQAIAVCRGYRASLRPMTAPSNPKHSQAYMLKMWPGADAVMLKFGREESNPDERAWCVTVDSGAIITRRAGRVLVLGNCKGYDNPQVQCIVDCNPRRSSLAPLIQAMGRGMRSAPGKSLCAYIDHAGNLEGWWEDIMEIWEHGVSDLDDRYVDRIRREGKERKPVACPQCGYIAESLAATGGICPSCGWQRSVPPIQNVAGYTQRMEAIAGAVDRPPKVWEHDEAWTWNQLCAMAAREKKGDIEAARKSAAGMYKGLYSEWPAWGRPFTPDPNGVQAEVEKRVKSNRIRYAKGKAKAGR